MAGVVLAKEQVRVVAIQCLAEALGHFFELGEQIGLCPGGEDLTGETVPLDLVVRFSLEAIPAAHDDGDGTGAQFLLRAEAVQHGLGLNHQLHAPREELQRQMLNRRFTVSFEDVLSGYMRKPPPAFGFVSVGLSSVTYSTLATVATV